MIMSFYKTYDKYILRLLLRKYYLLKITITIREKSSYMNFVYIWSYIIIYNYTCSHIKKNAVVRIQLK